MLFLCNIANVAQKNIILGSFKTQNHVDLAFIIILITMWVATTSPETSMCEVPKGVSRKLQLTVCGIMAL